MICRSALPFLFLLFSTLWICAEETLLPNAPLGQVVDQTDWLGEERKKRLDERLRYFRASAGVDVFVVIWDRELPSDQTLKEFALTLGTEWSRENFWALVIKQPESIQRPEIQYGGIFVDGLKTEQLDYSVGEAITRGLKDWTDQARVEAIALEIGEEFSYLKQRRVHERTVVREHMEEIAVIHRKGQKKRTLRLVLAGLGLILTLSVGLFFGVRYFCSKKPYTFPETRWRKRLGGTWSGGSTIVATLPSSSKPS